VGRLVPARMDRVAWVRFHTRLVLSLGALTGTGYDPFRLFIGYVIGGGIMIIGGVVELVLGVAAEGRNLGRLPGR
jgi:hypothetical protein